MTKPKVQPATERVSLVELVKEYLLERETSRGYREQIEVVVRQAKKFHGAMVHVDDLSDDFVNRFLAHEGQAIKPETLKNRRRIILTLWRAAYDRDLIAELPKRVRKITSPPVIPTAWTEAEVKRLLKAVDDFVPYHVHRKAKVQTRLFWRALILVVWDSGLRRVDWERLKRSDIGPDGSLIVIQHKTGWPVTCRLRPETVKAIDATKPENREFIFGLGSSTRSRSFARIVKAAGLTGALKKLRKSSATAVERVRPGSASSHLGHKNPTMAGRHYVDPRIAQTEKAQTPSLSPAEEPKPIGGDILAWL